MKTFYLILILILFSACNATKLVYVPVEKEVVKTEYKDKLVKDSIYVQDSIFIHHKGDTIFKEKYKKIYKDKLVRDSIYIHDSIKIDVPYPVPGKEVNKLHQWQIILMVLGGGLIGYVGVRIVMWIRKIK